MEVQTDVLIVGGGLSGVSCAHNLSSLGVRWILVEAGFRLGGRLVNAPGRAIDMGGAWFWPPHQPLVKKYLEDADMKYFVQPDDPSCQRIEGGAISLVESLVERCEKKGKIVLGFVVKSCIKSLDHLTLTSEDGRTAVAKRVVFAAPPAVLFRKVIFHPPLSSVKRTSMERSRTWMGNVTKVAVEFSEKIWDPPGFQGEPLPTNMGLKGGPAFQVYDASTPDGCVVALTFFALADPADGNDAALAARCVMQLQSVWLDVGISHGRTDRLRNYNAHHVVRWPSELYVGGMPYNGKVNPHPVPDSALASNEWEGSLLFAGTECDLHCPGLIEGALSSANRVVESLKSLSK